jgi:hypothetical protein
MISITINIDIIIIVIVVISISIIIIIVIIITITLLLLLWATHLLISGSDHEVQRTGQARSLTACSSRRKSLLYINCDPVLDPFSRFHAFIVAGPRDCNGDYRNPFRHGVVILTEALECFFL